MMNLSIIRPLSKKEVKIAWLEVNTPTGNYVIQPEHAPMVLVLEENKDAVICLSNGKQESVHVKRGIVEITRTSATLLLNE